MIANTVREAKVYIQSILCSRIFFSLSLSFFFFFFVGGGGGGAGGGDRFPCAPDRQFQPAHPHTGHLSSILQLGQLQLTRELDAYRLC